MTGKAARRRPRAAGARRRGARLAVAALAAVVTSVATPGPCHAWETTLDGAAIAADDYWNAVAVDRVGDLLAAGVSLQPASDFDCAFAVTKIARASGTVLWRRDLPDCGADETFESSGGEQVIADPRGDVVVGRRDIGARAFGVYKFAGGSGALLWHRRVGDYPKHGPYVHATALDGAGHVIAAAGLGGFRELCATDLVVAKLDAATGAEIWRRTLRGTFSPTADCEDEAFSQANAVAVDAAGDVLVSGFLVNTGGSSTRPAAHSVVLKLSGADGSEIWRQYTGRYRDSDTGLG